MNSCFICDRLDKIQKKQNGCFVFELETGYVVFGDDQFYPGYTLFLSKIHASELHELPPQNRQKYLEEMAIVAEAVFTVFQPEKLNYELLGNKDSHLHWHLFPRYKDDPDPLRPVWSYPKEKRSNEKTKITAEFIKKYKPLLVKALKKL